ncbi:hypothetical protein CJD36_003915 [Flavipsychrobacter stenotrophus]|uniref:Uncharacterized protein n=1 Tax=Flavipsychrobacter stenotrophus TaxID=2077091 RepID=A0A2S7T203_9BACT|nr:hypothetical protein [Flavipsychrobacter stenotrophus]PQJ12901.1 hypothetical protein CJD36_003915 [Flavipsychrobacter stenotrophus]
MITDTDQITETKESLTLQLEKLQKEIKNLKILGMTIVVIGIIAGCYSLIDALDSGHISSLTAAPIFAALLLVRVVAVKPLKVKKDLAWEIDNKLMQMS